MKSILIIFLIFIAANLNASYMSGGTSSSSSGSSAWGGITGTLSAQTDLNTALGLKATAATPTFTTSANFAYGTVSTVPYFDASKNLVSSAVTPTELGYVSGVTSALQTQLGLLAPKANPSFSGVALSASGAAGAPSYSFTSAASSGMYWDGSALRLQQVGVTGLYLSTGRAQVCAGSDDCFDFYNDGTYTLNRDAQTGFTFYIYSTDGGQNSALSAIYTAGNKQMLVSSKNADVGIGAGTPLVGGANNASLTVRQGADISNVGGTTTVNASTTVTGSGTYFLRDYSVGDLVSVSSASSTYATILAITDNTTMTVSAVLGNGTSQTLNRKRVALSVNDNSSDTPVFQVSPLGAVIMGDLADTTSIHRMNGAIVAHSGGGTPVLGAAAAPVNGSPATWHNINVNGTAYVYPLWTAP